METIDELLVEALAAAERFWFVRELQIIDRCINMSGFTGLTDENSIDRRR